MTVLKTLPRSIAKAIPGIHWSLADVPPPLHYEPLEKLQKIRPESKYELFRDIPATIDNVFSSSTTEARHYGMIALSLLLLGHGYVDECHDIVLALSWPSTLDITYNGKTEFDQATKSVRAFSSYVHCMVHRKEAFHVGEFGLVGIENAKFWSGQVTQSGGEHDLPQTELKEQVQVLAKEYQSDDNSVQEWCDKIANKGQYMNHRATHDLAMTVLQQKDREENSDKDKLRTFAEHVIESEMRILLFHALQRAGFEADKESVLKDQKTEL